MCYIDNRNNYLCGNVNYDVTDKIRSNYFPDDTKIETVNYDSKEFHIVTKVFVTFNVNILRVSDNNV